MSSTHRHRSTWIPGDPEQLLGSEESLQAALDELEHERVGSSSTLVREASAALLPWLYARDEAWDWARAGADLDRLLAGIKSVHAWRGPVASWIETLWRVVGLAQERRLAAPANEVLSEELGLWLDGEGSASSSVWNREALAPGKRLIASADCAAAAGADVQTCEVIIVHGFSDTVALALEALQDAGRRPEVIVTEGGPNLGGRRMAQRLALCGIKVALIYDAALPGRVEFADRIWLGTDAIGAAAFAAPVGTRSLLEHARRIEVPSAIITTSDKLMPRGELALPTWASNQRWLLWEDAPAGVEIESQCYESVPLDLPNCFATEAGLESAAQLALRCLRTEASPVF